MHKVKLFLSINTYSIDTYTCYRRSLCTVVLSFVWSYLIYWAFNDYNNNKTQNWCLAFQTNQIKISGIANNKTICIS